MYLVRAVTVNWIPAIVVIIIVILLTVALWATFWYKRKKTKYRIPQMKWASNTLHDTDESNNDDHACEMDNEPDDLMMLPKWLQEKKDMIFPQECIQTGQEIGYGQYGTVFKGKLALGNSVYVDILY